MKPDKPAILIVDDEAKYLTDFQDLFSRKFNPVTASSGKEALKLIGPEIKVIVADQRMPRMTGIELLTEVAKKYPQIYRILLTGYADAVGVDRALQEGIVNRYLTKDRPLKEIEFAIQEGLEKYRNLHGI